MPVVALEPDPREEVSFVDVGAGAFAGFTDTSGDGDSIAQEPGAQHAKTAPQTKKFYANTRTLLPVCDVSGASGG